MNSSSENDPYIDSHGSPPWLPMTFNLTYELPQFAVYFQYREDQHVDNTWIIKPINLTRSIDVSVTNLFDMVLRLPESGSKIACKYISTPALLRIPGIEGEGVKFDIRYMLLLRSIRPLKLFAHRVFSLRFASKPFSIDELDDSKKHFTVVNHSDNSHIQEMDCQTFIDMFNEQYSQNWSSIEQTIFQVFRELFQCATIEEPPLGIGSCASSRALYAVDMMLEINDQKEIQAKLLEVNFAPDCPRVCSRYPTIYNQIFNALFRDLIDDEEIKDISM